MTRRNVLLSGIFMAAAIYVTGLYLVTSLPPIRTLIRTTVIGSADITQSFFLIVSLILILLLGRGRLSQYGFRLCSIKPVLWAILISAGVQLIMLIVMIASVMISGQMPRTGLAGVAPIVGQLGMSLPRTIVSVWLIASTCEEIFYRGLILGHLQPLREIGFRFFGLHISLPVIVCALMFGLGHLCLLSMMPPVMVANIVLATTIAGFITGYFRESTGSLIPAIVAHMTFNIVGYTVPRLLGGAG